MLAENSSAAQRHGALVLKGGKVVARGVNLNKNHPDIFENDDDIKAHASVHAEVRAARQVEDLNGAVVIVARIRKDGSVGNSEPCSNCDAYLKSRGVKRVIHT